MLVQGQRSQTVIFFSIPASAVEAPTANPNGTNTLFANNVSTFFVNSRLFY